MKITVANYKNWCVFCHNESFVNVEIFYNWNPDIIEKNIQWADVLDGDDQTAEGKDEYDSIPKEDRRIIRICKNCIELLWNSVANVKSILCANCSKPLHVRHIKSDSGKHEYKIQTPVTDPRHGLPFCSDACYNEYIAGHP